jgi:DNA-binding response OmpR family regulator
MAVRHHLSEGGFHVLEAENGTEAIERAREFTAPLDLLVTDMVLPGVNGAEVAKEVRRLHPEVSVIGMSAHSPAMLERAGNLAADMEIMEKPFDGKQLLRRVRAVLTDSASASQ